MDDDRLILEFTERALISLGFSCVTTTDMAAALHLLEHERDIRVLITDMRLGLEKNGAQLARQALALRPDLGVLISSGDHDSLQIASEELPHHVELLPKPYRRSDLMARLSRLL